MPRPGSHASRDWPLLQAALAAHGAPPLPAGARRMLARAHRAIDRQQRAEHQHLHFMRTDPDQPSSEAWAGSVRHIRESGLRAVRALQRWRGEPRDKDALAELVRALALAAHTVRDSFSDGHTQRHPGTLHIERVKDFKGAGPVRLVLGFLWHIPKDLATELPPHADAARRSGAADDAVRDLAGLVAHASRYGPQDAPHVFERRFAAFQEQHLRPAGTTDPRPRLARAVPQRA
jgi:hypothetical protein